MQLEFLFLGRTKESFLSAGIEDYLKRLNNHVRAEVKVIKEKKWQKGTSEACIIEEEGKLLLSHIDKSSLLVALDPEGLQLDSIAFADKISRWEGESRKKITFALGGHLGLAAPIRKGADEVLSLSKLTFTHEMARLILMEQVYRAYTIKAGSRYHK